MKMVKSLLLGAAAGFVAMAGAQAADLPVKAKPVQYVKICSLYGAGFYYMPGTDTCIKIGGFIRAEININAGNSFNPAHNENFDSRAYERYNLRARLVPTFDVRSQTEYGTLRAYAAFNANIDQGGAAAGQAILLYRAFIQFAGFTAGQAQSFFDFYSTPAYSNTTNVWGSDTGGVGDFVWAYTAQFGNGLSATISAEAENARRTGASGPGGAGAGWGGIFNGGGAISGYAGRNWMDMVGNVRVDQAWGSAQIMGALHQLRTFNGLADDGWGYALGAGVMFNLPMLSKGDNFSVQGTYSEGAVSYAGSGVGGGFNITQDGLVGRGLSYDAVTVGAAGSALELTEAWSVVAGFQHVWNPKWKSSLYGTYGEVNFNAAASLILGGAGADASWSMYQLGSRTIWTVVPNLDLSVDVMYNHLDTSFPTIAGFGDQSWWQGMFRAQRNFYP